MRSLSFLLAALLAGPPLTGDPVPPPPRRAIVVSFDGAGGETLEEETGRGSFGPDGFLRAERTGFCAERLEEATPSLTAVSHASISAGAPPSATGIVANSFHPATAPLTRRVSGFETESQVETIWEAAARQGKRVATLAWPGAFQATARTTTPVGLRWAEAKGRPFTWKASAADSPFPDALFALPEQQASFSPPKILPIEKTGGTSASSLARFRFVAIDTTDDGRRNYDVILVVRMDGSLSARARAGDWFPLSERRDEDLGDRDVLLGRWCKVLALTPDLSAVRVYVGREGRTLAAPEDFRRTLDREAGFWPGPPDEAFLVEEGDSRSYLEQAARFSEFFVNAFRVADRRGDWDLLLAYVPVLDEAEHVLTLSDPRQPGYTPEKAAEAAATLREVWKLADSAAAAYLGFAGRGDVFLLSDHGMRAVARSFLLQEFLRRKGFLVPWTDPHGKLATSPRSPVDAVFADAVGYLVVNRAGFLEGGELPPAKADTLVLKLKEVLEKETDENGEKVFATVLTRAEARPLGLDHPNAGDLIVIAAGGTTLARGFSTHDTSPLFIPADPPGQHGFGPDPALDGIFFHVGDGIAREKVTVFRSVDVAGRVAARLGIEKPRSAR